MGMINVKKAIRTMSRILIIAALAVLWVAPSAAQAADIDNGTWTDRGSCPRGGGGAYTGATDRDNGNITDYGGYGRGAPYC